MQNVARQHRLSALRAKIAAIEKRPLLNEGAAVLPAGNGKGWEALLAAPAGLLQEVHTDEQRNGGAVLGFALGLARGLLTPERPALLFMQLVHEAQDTGLPYGAGLAHFGIAPETVILGRMKTLTELLWAAEEAIACRAVAAVIAEVAGAPKTLDFTASRRLSLRAASGGVSVFLLRHGRDREATAAQLRWRVNPVLSGAVVFDARMPGRPRWQVSLEKSRLGEKATETGVSMMLDWTENGFERTKPHREAKRAVSSAPAFGAQPAALGYRLSQTG